jgi:hypothetical protein
MGEIEYKHVRFGWGFLTDLSRKRFDRKLMDCLEEHGKMGWDLKGILHEGQFQMHAHLIFGRPVSKG